MWLTQKHHKIVFSQLSSWMFGLGLRTKIFALGLGLGFEVMSLALALVFWFQALGFTFLVSRGLRGILYQ